MSFRTLVTVIGLVGAVTFACSSTVEDTTDGGWNTSFGDHGGNEPGDVKDNRDLRHPFDLSVGDDSPKPQDTVGPKQDSRTPTPDNKPQDAGCAPGTDCYKDQWVIMGSKITVIVGNEAYNPDWYLLDLLPPGTLTVDVLVRSTGFNQLTLVDAFLENGANPSVAMQWTTPGYPGALPATLMPNDETHLSITYSPPAGDSMPIGATLSIWSSDPDHPLRQVVFFPRQSGPDIMIPNAVKNYGCGSYCHDRDFQIENGGNEDLIIQSLQFDKNNGEWSLDGAPAPGTVIKPAGSPGYAPASFLVKYCDTDGNTLDDNKLAIYSNDPDENPAFIFLNIIQQNECP